MFANPRFACWPAVSLYYYALKYRGLYLSLSTFYKYARRLGLKRTAKKFRSGKTGLRATLPNQYLHVDTTFWKLASGNRAAIVFVSDNYSKAILGWNVSMHHSSRNVIEALHNAIGTIRAWYPGHHAATLIADGGAENHASGIDELLCRTRPPAITKIIARKDIRFSNSPVEAINKILKRYLRHYHPQTEDALRSVLALSVHDYNEVRPHGSLGGREPMAAYRDPSRAVCFRDRISRARTARVGENRRVNCTGCTSS